MFDIIDAQMDLSLWLFHIVLSLETEYEKETLAAIN